MCQSIRNIKNIKINLVRENLSTVSLFFLVSFWSNLNSNYKLVDIMFKKLYNLTINSLFYTNRKINNILKDHEINNIEKYCYYYFSRNSTNNDKKEINYNLISSIIIYCKKAKKLK